MSDAVEIPDSVAFFSAMGAAAAMMFSAIGAAYGTAKSGGGISSMAVARPEMVMKSVIPVVMAGILAIYGVVVAVLISQATNQNMHNKDRTDAIRVGYMHFGAGLSVGLAGLAAGYTIGVVGDAGVRGTVHQPKLYVGMILILIFAEVLGLYGLITALVMIYSK